ncbi:MAG: YeeE/YedE family protein [Rubrivivax sp.]|jgi:uncharacterized membrane protein YedE/YeeE|nr:YeeE/YedE family protein [Rubrivivax sp.]
MTMDWASFTPWQALAGGALIGLAAAMLIVLNGRIAGISGIVGGLLRPARHEIPWRLAMLAGLIGAPLLWQLWAPLPAAEVSASSVMLLAAGLLVGLGTRWAGGCTSGHGVCGLSRLSVRSLVATLSFMAAGFLTVYVVRHGLV